MSVVALSVALLVPRPSSADEVEVTANTALQLYDVTGPSTFVVWSRRRLTQTLSLRYVRPVVEADDEARVGAGANASWREKPTPKLATHVLLRLDQELGDTCSHTEDVCFAIVDPERRGSYTPIVEDGLLDLPSAYVELYDLPSGAVVRVGRQLHFNMIGFARIDGVSAHVEPASFIAFHGTFGGLVRRTSVAGSDAFVPTSAPRIPLGEIERADAPYVEDDVSTYVADGSAELGDQRIVRGRIAYRALLEDGGVVSRRIGAGVSSQPITALVLSSHGIVDPVDLAVVDAQVAASLLARPYSASLELERHVPRFDAGSIWAYFDVAPTWRLAGRLSRSFTPTTDAFVGIQGRSAQLSTGIDYDLGASVGARVHAPKDELYVSGFFVAGELGPLWGASAAGLHRLGPEVALEAELSLMRIADPLRGAMDGISVAEHAGARFQLTQELLLRVLSTHAYATALGHRLSLLALVQLEAFR